MTQPPERDESARKKRTIEFDMFVRDLEPEEEEKIKGGSGSRETRADDESSCDNN